MATACFYGCGAPLQTSELDAPGYVDKDAYELVDIVDFNGSFLSRVRDLAGANPIILVVTKVDLLPKGTDFNCVGDWVVEATTKKQLTVLSVHLTSSKSLVGIAGVASEIQKEKERDVYILVSCLQKGDGRDIQYQRLNGFSIFWGGLVRIDILKVLPETCLPFYGPKRLPIHAVPTDEAHEFYKKELGVLLTPPTGKDRAAEWRGLETVQQLQINFEGAERPASDVAISGLGWITIEPKCKSLGVSESNFAETIKGLHFAVHVPKPVEIFVRPSIPVGKAGAEWYQYRELTEKEEETRTMWYF
ncbi:NO-associated protein 1 [Hibiscus syriacus]|uniref:NO-associated protein 1 n=1 Tax=Hibiscus syriacus TaxID=106335 RepID=A0A6A3BU61_HIBSY|nr:NO-associated protein 1 [Hibiscus syriacus]